MNIKNIFVNQRFKNYNALCRALDIEPKGNAKSWSRTSQEKCLKQYFNYTTNRNMIIITEIFKTKRERVINNGGRKPTYDQPLYTPTEIAGDFDGFYVYSHKINNEVIYIGKGCCRRATKGSRRYPLENVNVSIIKRFNNEKEALLYERQLIEHYQSIGECKYNASNTYHTGFTREYKNNKEDVFNKELEAKYTKMFKYEI